MKIALSLLFAALLVGAGGMAAADDGQMLRRSVSSPPGEVQDPEPEGEHAFVSLMNFRVPTQRADGTVEPVEYYDVDGTLKMTLETAKPLINVFVYGPVNTFDDFSQSGFPGHGRRDAFGAVSLDDGETWKRTNLSSSADLSSFEITDPIPDPGVPEGGGSVIEADPDGPFFYQVLVQPFGTTSVVTFAGNTNTATAQYVVIRDAVTQQWLFLAISNASGDFYRQVLVREVPCWFQAGVLVDGAPVWGPAAAAPVAEGECVNPDPGVEETLITDYPGEVTNVFHSVAGNKVLVAWQSKFCSSGFPGYSLDDTVKDEIATYLGINREVDMYLEDLFVVAGNQLSVDYREQEEYAGEYDDVGEVPYNCLWTARGVLRENPEAPGTSELVWFQAERLTSGRRDVNRIETSCVAGAGCAVTWQEDPAGLRPGEGEGAGTGWAGATTNSKTDVWYSFVEWEDMDIVDVNGEPLPLADNILDTGRPQPYVPMMVPARLTNNDRCTYPVVNETYCMEDIAGPYGIKNQCVDQVEIPLGPQGDLQSVCVVDANDSGSMDAGDMPNLANTAASRPRLNLQPRDSDGDGVTDDAWVIIVHEEDKGLGRYGYLNTEEWVDEDTYGFMCGDPDTDPEDTCIKEIGKNQWYISFALGTPQTSVLDGVAAEDVDFSMLENLVAQQNMLNAPEVNWITGTFYPPMFTGDMWDFGDELNYSIINTEIARRASLMSQSLAKAETGTSGLMAMPLFKEGIINQGGPADIMARRIVADVEEEVQCPIDDNVDTDQPVIVEASGDEDPSGRAVLRLVVDGLDGDPATPTAFRNAVTKSYYDGYQYENPEETEGETFAIPLALNSDVPCAIQAGNVVELASSTDYNAQATYIEWGPWTEVTNLPEGYSCVGPIPEECLVVEEVTPTFVAAAVDQAVENPYDFSNVECAWYDGEGDVTEGTWLYTDGLNPYYPKGLCTAPAINLSGRTPHLCDVTGDSDGVCPGEADMTCVDDESFGQLCLSTTDPEDNKLLDKLLSWYECPGWNGTDVSNGGNTGDSTIPDECYQEPDSALLMANLDDRSWYMPVDIAKAHRGFLDGDFVSMIYAWSPNWKLNAVGQDRYELYTRRSFDGGLTWTVLPGSFEASDGETYSSATEDVVTCETWRDGADSTTDSHICTAYEDGDPEQSRNVSQHKSMKITTLDPRYTPTISGMPEECPDWYEIDGVCESEWLLFEPITDENLQGALDPTDVRNPSRYFIVFESGDNTTVAVGEAEPLNLDYGRAEFFGDYFTVWAETDTDTAEISLCYPNDPHETTDVDWATGTGFCNEFDTMEGFPDSLSEEASITASAYGDFLYGVWGQFNVDEFGEFIDGDSMFRRIWYLDDYISQDNAWTLPGTSQ